jgi:hypothetical protein
MVMPEEGGVVRSIHAWGFVQPAIGVPHRQLQGRMRTELQHRGYTNHAHSMPWREDYSSDFPKPCIHCKKLTRNSDRNWRYSE